MAQYRYKAKTEEGRTIGGILDAADEEELYGKLRQESLYMLSAHLVNKEKHVPRLKAKVLSEFCRSLGTLLQAGVSLVRALNIIAKEETLKPQHQKLYDNLLKSVRQGNTLSDAMEEQGEAFPPMLIYMFRSAEASGSMDKVSMRMAGHYENEHKLKSKVSNAMVYPCILMGMIVVVVLFIFTYVIPQFSDLFSQMPSLPILTRIVMGCSDGLKKHWLPLLIIVFVSVVLIGMLIKVPAVRLKLDHLKLKLPVFGKLLRVIYTARFSRTLCSLYSSGLPIVTALTIGRNTVGNKYIEMQFTEAIDKVRTGMNLSEAISGIDGFSQKLAASIMIGEETGSLDSMLDSIANSLDYESEMAINKMVTFMEPILIIVMAVIVGVIVIAVIMPIYGSYSAIEQSGA